MVNDEIGLINKSVQGEQNAFEELIRKYQDMVYGLAFHMIGNFTDAQDITQQVFIAVYLKLSELKDPNKFVNWLKRITVNACNLWLREQHITSHFYERIGNNSHPVSTPEQEYEKKELSLIVLNALESLSEKNRLAVTLYYIDGLTQSEVAQFLGTTTSTVEKRISRSKRQLKKRMMQLVKDEFRNNSLSDDFVKKVRDTVNKAREAQINHNFEEALVYTDKALDNIDNLPQSHETLKLKEEVLWLKGDVVRFPLGMDEALRHYEQALELAKTVGDEADYAGKLVSLSGIYSHSKEKSAEYKQKALKIYEDIGDLMGQAEIWMWQGFDIIVSNPKDALAKLQRALDLFSQTKDGHPGYESVCRSAVALIGDTKYIHYDSKLIKYDATSEILRKMPDKLIYAGQPGWGYSAERYDWERYLADTLHYANNGDVILDYSLKVGDEIQMQNFSFTFKPLKVMLTIEGDSESVDIMAGNFKNCLKIKAVITPNPDEDGAEMSKKLNQIYCGTKQVWFAPGIGVVKLIFGRANGIYTHAELAEYHIEEESNDYFPLSVGNRWVYCCPELDERYIARDSYMVAVQKEDRYYIDHYGYIYFSGSKEEYDALGK